jgi:ribulose-phosphate 3-epimerase
MSNQVDFVGKVQEVGAYVGLGIDLKTPVSDFDSTILTNLDVVLVMSVPAGFGGQKYDRRVLDKIKELDEIRVRDDTPYKIHEDGGVTLDNIDDARVAGVDEVSVGKRLFKGNIEDNIDRLTKAAYK